LTQRLNSFLTSNQELRQIANKVRQLRAIQSHYAQIMPATLVRASQVMQMEHKVLTLAANNSAVAAKLRQMTPELVRQLQLRGCEVTGIQVRVQVSLPPILRPAVTPVIGARGKEELGNLAETMADSPLKSALQRLAGIKNRPE